MRDSQRAVQAKHLGVVSVFTRPIDRSLDPFEIGFACIGPNGAVKVGNRRLVRRKLRVSVAAAELVVAESARWIFDQLLHLKGSVVYWQAIDVPVFRCLPPHPGAAHPLLEPAPLLCLSFPPP